MTSGTGVMEKLIDYVSKARATALPPEVLTKTKHHILDTLAAMISGTTLKPGEFALKYARLQEGCIIRVTQQVNHQHGGGSLEGISTASPRRRATSSRSAGNWSCR